MQTANTVTIGMDVSDRYCQIAVLDAGGTVVGTARVATELAGIRRWFGRYPESRVVLEVGTHSPWLSRLLAEQGHDGPNDDDELEPSPRSGHRKIDQSGWAPGEELDLEEDNSDCESSLGSLEHDDQTRW